MTTHPHASPAANAAPLADGPKDRLPVLMLGAVGVVFGDIGTRSEEHTSELQSLMRISYAVFCLKKKNKKTYINTHNRKLITSEHKIYNIIVDNKLDVSH